jgi:cobalt-zinc-cadmium efflux system outer membrane protein
LDIERMYSPGFGSMGRAGEKNVSLTQELRWPSSLWLEGSRASLLADVADAAAQAKARGVLSRARAAYADYFYAYGGFESLRSSIEIMRRLARETEARYAAGRTGQTEALKAQVELSKTLNAQLLMESELSQARSLMNALRDQPSGTELGRPQEPAEPPELGDYESMEKAVLDSLPELRAARSSLRAEDKSLALARSQWLPDMMLQVRQRTAPMDGGNTWDGVVGFGLPLWFWSPAAAVREARANREAAQADLRGLQAFSRYELRRAYDRFSSARKAAQLCGTGLVPQAEQYSKLVEASYLGGRASFSDFLDAERTLLDARLQHLQAVADRERALAELERMLGRDL